jgi:hypothetical protein
MGAARSRWRAALRSRSLAARIFAREASMRSAACSSQSFFSALDSSAVRIDAARARSAMS